MKETSRVAFNLSKGLIYGVYIGLIFSVAIYLVAEAVIGFNFLPSGMSVLLGALIFSTGMLAGVSHEYGKWLSTQTDVSLLFTLSNALLQGVVMGLYFGVSIYLVAVAVAGFGFIAAVMPVLLASLVFAVMILGSIGVEYDKWLDAEEKKLTVVSPSPASTGPGPPTTA